MFYVAKTGNVNAEDKIELVIAENTVGANLTVVLSFPTYKEAFDYVQELVATGKYYFYDSSSKNFSNIIARLNKVANNKRTIK